MAKIKLTGSLVALAIGFTPLAAPPAQAAAPVKTISNLHRAYEPKTCDRLYAETMVHIKAQKSGDTIRMVEYLWDNPDVTKALIEAHKRGVNVKVILDVHAASKAADDLTAALGKNTKARSYVFRPTGSGMSKSKYGNVHFKTEMFSRGSITRLGSANLASHNLCGSANINDYYYDTKTYFAIRRYFDKLSENKGTPLPKKYRSFTSGKNKVWLAPGTPDVIYEWLRTFNTRKECKGRVINISIFQWSNSEVERAKQLWAMAKLGCKVRVIWNHNPKSSRQYIGVETARWLLKTKDGKRLITVRNGLKVGYGLTHDKMLVTNGMAFGGSQNWMEPSRQINADSVTRTTDPDRVAEYRRHFELVWKHSTPTTTLPTYPPISPADAQSAEHDLG